MANMDNLSSLATINRLLTLNFHLLNGEAALPLLTRLDLTVHGSTGTHGDRAWEGDAGSAGSVRFWTRVLNSLPGLQHLTLHDAQSADADLRFSNTSMTDLEGSILEWLLPMLVLPELRSLRLHGFCLRSKTLVAETLTGQWARLQMIFFDDVRLLLGTGDEDLTGEGLPRHADGCGWHQVCVELAESRPDVRVRLRRPRSGFDVEDSFELPLASKERLVQMENVKRG